MRKLLPALAAFSLLLPFSAFAAAKATAPKKRILFVAPHPDDETLGTGAEIWKAARSRGVDYRVVVVTCGDAYEKAFETWKASGQARDLDGDGKITYLDFGTARHAETLAALSLLGVPAEKVIFLGYPDGGLDKMSGPEAYRSPFTGASAVPYSFAFRKGAPYKDGSVVDDLARIITDFNPQLVYSTTPTDEHPDHAQTREFVRRALLQAGGKRTHLEYLIHWEKHVPTWPEATAAWKQPPGHHAADHTVRLASLGMKPGLKKQAIERYATQTAVEHDYLVGFAKDAENFWNPRASVADYLVPASQAKAAP